jgi:nitroreductase
MDVLEALRTRRSIGKLEGDVSEAEVREFVEAAVCAPNHKLTEPWRFTVLRGDARARLGAAWAASEAARTTLTGADREAYLSREARKPLRAPVIIVASTVTSDDPVLAVEDFAATAAAVQNLLLAAHARGFGTVWRTGGMAYDPAIVDHLGLGQGERIVGFVYVGRPAIEPQQPPRSSVDAFLRFLN